MRAISLRLHGKHLGGIFLLIHFTRLLTTVVWRKDNIMKTFQLLRIYTLRNTNSYFQIKFFRFSRFTIDISLSYILASSPLWSVSFWLAIMHMWQVKDLSAKTEKCFGSHSGFFFGGTLLGLVTCGFCTEVWCARQV